MENSERYLKSIDKSLRRIKAAVHGILVFLTFLCAIIVFSGIYLYVQRDDLLKSYYKEFKQGMDKTIDAAAEKIADSVEKEE